jgi:class 3 adenylate cyclase/TPR repeat protein
MASDQPERKLAAILAADVVGFSRLAGTDEERTLARLRALRSDLIDPTIEVYRGRVVKRTGDGVLVEFRSVVDAVRCAIEVQSGMVERNAGLPPERRIDFRIGVHLGDVVEETDGDLMGDGVNIAARLEGIAEPGMICLSEDAYRQVRARLDVAVADLGNRELKNIALPIRVYSLAVGNVAHSDTVASASRKKVLPAIAGIIALIALSGVATWRFMNVEKLVAPDAPRATAAEKGAKADGPSTAHLLADQLFRRGDQAFDKRKYAEAKPLYQEAADQGSAGAMNALGVLYQNGWGVDRDFAEAMRWYRKSADLGYGWAQSNVGEMFRQGLGVDHDYAEAMRWYRKAADKGNAGGQNGIGLLFQFGLGVGQDYTEALRWFRMSANQGYSWGQTNVGSFYRQGFVVGQDYAEAMRCDGIGWLPIKAIPEGRTASASSMITGLGSQRTTARRWSGIRRPRIKVTTGGKRMSDTCTPSAMGLRKIAQLVVLGFKKPRRAAGRS